MAVNGGKFWVAMNRCKVCSHPRRREIELALSSGQSYRDVARQHGLTKDSLHRHVRGGHTGALLAEAREKRVQERVREAVDILDELLQLRARAMQMLTHAEEERDARAWAAVSREVRECLELQAELLGQLRRGAQVGVLVASPAWQRLAAAIVEALAPYPEARSAVVRVLSEVASGGD